MKNVVFTICAKNYLAQALSLKESTLKYNDVDFYIYLSDDKGEEELPEVVLLDESWIPNWKKMAFKYNVIEFSTSIKPFCIDHLYKKGYEKVIYLDPDIYVFNSLNYIFNSLESKSIILTPHRCIPIIETKGFIREETVSNVGIYNLGFIGLKNNHIGKKVVDWWKERLEHKCYIDLKNGLFVDQKWMDFIPGFFPDDILISQHLGLNIASWNLQEREIVYKNGRPFVQNKFKQDDIYPLVFFHFSGYSPNTPNQLDKRIQECNVFTYPALEPLIKEYNKTENKNKYSYYSSLNYSFNCFNNNIKILELNRFLYSKDSTLYNLDENPFCTDSQVYKTFKKKNLLSSCKNINSIKKPINKIVVNKRINKINILLKLAHKLLRFDNYHRLINLFKYLSDNNNHLYLLK